MRWALPVKWEPAWCSWTKESLRRKMSRRSSLITRKIRGSRTFSPRYYRGKIRFSISFVFRKNFLIYFIHFLEGVHRLVTIPCYIKHVARTHISISFITLGDFREEAPTPSKRYGACAERALFVRRFWRGLWLESSRLRKNSGRGACRGFSAGVPP